ncbi:hypothetical protein PAEPH01_1051 [Pancytospora epiphaga]|nr:hypothetical protein PAEPH01_1051 [Pancytospora epiphaga]
MNSSIGSDLLTSESSKKEGLKYIAQTVYAILREQKECTYQFICQNVTVQNTETANRRIYDVLNVMRAVKVIGKKGKIYYLINNNDDIRRKRAERNKLKDMKETFLYIIARNELMGNSEREEEKLYLPFIVVSTDDKADLHCDTNDNHTYFNFKSNRPLKVYEDLAILKEIREQSNAEAKEQSATLSLDSFIF